jgi:phosphate acyltransferase
MICIAVDAMGGDHAPRMVVAGLNAALKRLPDTRFLLFGDAEGIQALLQRNPRVRRASEVRPTSMVIASGEKPSSALRNGRDSSMRRAINAVVDGEADAVISAGNTGALMAMAKYVLRTLPGIDRPAIASLCPTKNGSCVMLDLGANVECTAENLVQFAVMGEVFARTLLRLERPSVGLLNIGEEEVKGNEAVKQAAAILQRHHHHFRFHGFVEGDDIGEGVVDVVVTDGFTGNVALKTMEGTARLCNHILRGTLTNSWLARLGALLARPSLRRMRKRVDPRSYNGAMFLGLNGVCIKSHGGTDALGFANAVDLTIRLVRDRVIDGIREDYDLMRAARPEVPSLAANS